MTHTLPEKDLKHVLELTEDLWGELKGERIFISGATGFFGSWLTESFLYANDFFELNAKATLLTRNPDAFLQKAPKIARHPGLELYKGDIRSFEFPAGRYSFIIHAANESPSRIKTADPDKEHFEIITKGTEHILEFAGQSGCRKLLFTSSGAVYGRQPPELEQLSEDFEANKHSPVTAYGKGKRIAEDLCIAATHAFETKIARCFCFIGPYLPLNVSFAAGNFIRDALEGGPIHVNGDGTPFRSYLYMSDLAVWLWTIFLQGESGKPYNTGSEDAISIIELANRVAKISRLNTAPVVRQKPDPSILPERYVPSTKAAQDELGLRQTVSLDQAIEKTLSWYAEKSNLNTL